MAFEIGAIVGNLVLNDGWSTSLNKADKSLKNFGQQGAQTLGGLKSRAQQLEDLLNKARLGSSRFQALQAELQKTRQQITQATASAQTMTGAFDAIGGALASASIIAGIRGVSNLGASLEQTRVSLEVFLGSAEKADATIESLNRFANVTPFSNDQVLRAGKALLAFGSSVETVEERLKRVGDIAAGTGKDFNELATIYGKAMTAGVIQAEELNQLTEAGIPIIGALAEHFGVAESAIKKMGSDGLIAFEDLDAAFKAMTEEGGRFNDMMTKQSATFAGLSSTITGTLLGTLAKIGETLNELLKPAMFAIAEAVVYLDGLWNGLDESTQMAAVAFAAISSAGAALALALPALIPLITAVGAALKAAFITNPIGLVILGIAGTVAVLIAYWKELSSVFLPVADAMDRMGDAFNRMLAVIAPVIDKIRDFVDMIREKMGLNTQRQVGAFGLALQIAFAPIALAITHAVTALQTLFDAISVLTSGAGSPIERLEAAVGIMGDGVRQLGKDTIAVVSQIGQIQRTNQAAVASLYQLERANRSAAGAADENARAQERSNRAAREAAKDQGKAAMMSDSTLAGNKGSNELATAVKRFDKALPDDLFSNLGLSEFNKQIGQALKGMDAFSKLEFATKISAQFGQIIEFAGQAINQLAEISRGQQEVAANRLKQVEFYGDIVESLLKKQGEEELQAIQNAEDAKLGAMRDAMNERLALLDEEYARRKEQLEADKQAFIEAERAKFEENKLIILNKSADEEQRRVDEAQLEQDWQDYLQIVDEQWKEKLAQQESDFRGKRTDFANKEAQSIAKAEADKNAKLEEQRKINEAREKQTQKTLALFRYMGAVAALESTKSIERAMARLDFARSVAQIPGIIATFTAMLGPVGLIAGAAAAAGITALAAVGLQTRLSAIGSAFVAPPAELFFAEGGGVIAGPGSSTSDSIPVQANLSRGEAFMVMDAQRTRDMFDAAQQSMSRPAISIAPGAIVVYGSVSNEFAEMVAIKVADVYDRRLNQRAF